MSKSKSLRKKYELYKYLASVFRSNILNNKSDWIEKRLLKRYAKFIKEYELKRNL